jgi:CDP-paratose 2-epimerase
MSVTTMKQQWAGSTRSRATLITGGAGFVGANLAHRLLLQGQPVIILDNLSRAGVEKNLQWLRDVHGDAVEIAVEDIRDRAGVQRAVARARHVFHFAAQVAVTTSIVDPIEDFDINARGTLNVLEAIRLQPSPPSLVFTSTNKVYGGLENVALERHGQHYAPVAAPLRAAGISEAQPLDFHSPYGCSKGTADQYVRDYARTYGIHTVVFRMSCIYGPHQFGTEDQGWVAHFLVRALAGEPITIFGDGMQVRDILFVEDLVDAMLLAERNIARLSGEAFNIGGGPENTISLLDLLDRIETLHGERPHVEFEQWRTGDQRYYVSDTRKFQQATGWRPKVSSREGIERLYAWLSEARAGARDTRSASALIGESASLSAQGVR